MTSKHRDLRGRGEMLAYRQASATDEIERWEQVPKQRTHCCAKEPELWMMSMLARVCSWMEIAVARYLVVLLD